MLFSKLRNFIKSAAISLSAVHPLYFLAAYLGAVPFFALIYYQLPYGFYAPYAKFEPSGKSDAYEIGQIIQTAIRRSIQSKLNDGVADKWEWIPEMLYVQRVSGMEGSLLTFDLYIMAHKKNEGAKGLFQFPVSMTLQSDASLIISQSDRGQQIFRVFEMDEPKWLKAIDDPLEGLPDQVARDFRKVKFLTEEDRAISRFFDGLRGDPLSVSGSIGRMLYFSSIVITTVGFGDIVPMTALARFLVGLEAIFGIMLAGLFINAIAYRSARMAG